MSKEQFSFNKDGRKSRTATFPNAGKIDGGFEYQYPNGILKQIER